MPYPKPFSLNRRAFGLGAVSSVALGGLTGAAKASGTAAFVPRVHRFEQADPIPVNAYIVEGAAGLVVVDATLTNASSRALRAEVDALGKPLAAVLLTHPHPDHYAGIGNLIEGLDVQVIALGAVNDIVRRDDAEKDVLIGGVFGEAWPSNRVFPSQIVRDGDELVFGDMVLETRDIGPAESFHDSMFILKGERPQAFVGDLVYSMMHTYMADNRNPEWQRALSRLQAELAEDTVLHVGHGAPVTPAVLGWQSLYLDRFEQALAAADWRDPQQAESDVIAAMLDYLPKEDLLFFLQISIAPNAQRLGLI